ncbi:MAG: hypothetical protein K4H23_04470 [Mollicutes bacterium PWAP]|nr:hypothetical protein [Mollicutes bacterium PWAP]
MNSKYIKHQNYFKNKLKDFLKENILNSKDEYNDENFWNWIEKNSMAAKIEIFKSYKNECPNDFEKIISNLMVIIKNNIWKELIYSELKILLINNKNKHTGTKELNIFYQRFGIEYEQNFKIRQSHAGKIARFRTELRDSDQIVGIISGKVMKNLLKLIYEIDFDSATDKIKKDAIDGWCYTTNEDWLEEFYEYQMKQYESIRKHYEILKEKLEKERETLDFMKAKEARKI